MINKQNNYCRLEIFCFFKLNDEGNLCIKHNKDFGEDVYVEEYKDFNSVKNRIIYLAKKYSEKYYNTDIYSSQEEEKIYYKGNIDTSSIYRYPAFLLYNSWEEFLIVGYCPIGWLPPLQFITYTINHYINLYGEEQGGEKFLKIVGTSEDKNIVFLAPDWYTEAPSNLISEETSDLFIKEWMNKKEVSQEYQKIIFQKEIEKRELLIKE